LRLEPGESKTTEAREFPLGGGSELRAILESQREKATLIEKATSRIVPWVFCQPDRSRSKVFDAHGRKRARRQGALD
jgi:hypothetical protein